MLDLTIEAHREALRYAANVASGRHSLIGVREWHAVRNDFLHDVPLPHDARTYELVAQRANAWFALSSPAESAAIVRALLEGCGVDVRLQLDAQVPPAEPWDDCVVITQRAAGGLYVGHFYAKEGRTDEPRFTYSLMWTPIPSNGIPVLILRLLDATTREVALAALREASQ